MKKIFTLLLACIVLYSFATVQNVFATSTLNWTATSAGGGTTQFWKTISMSSTGSIILAGTYGNRIYLSTNSGSTWTETQPAGNVDRSWDATAVSSNGQTMIAGAHSGRLYISINSGSSWTETQPAGNADENWGSAAMSSNGQIILAGVYGGRTYLSTNAGTTWNETQPAGNNNEWWKSAAMSSDGQTILTGAINSSRLYLTTNGGTNWSETQPAGNTGNDWYGTSVSGNGQTLLAAADGGKVFISTNSGASWADAKAAAGSSNSSWLNTSMSSDGTKMMAADESRLYVSLDSGVTWAETQPAGNTTKSWWPTAINSDGSLFVAGIYGGGLYTGTIATPTSTPTPTNNPTQSTTNASTSTTSKTVTCSDAQPRAAPNLFQVMTQTDTATLYFAPLSGANTRYVISYGQNNNADNYAVSFNHDDRSGVISYTINYLYPGTWYFKVRGQNGCMPGRWSNILSTKVHGSNLSTLINPNTVLGTSTTATVETRKCTNYVVQSGDSLWRIAMHQLGNGTAFRDIMTTNGLQSSVIYAGQTLKIGCHNN